VKRYFSVRENRMDPGKNHFSPVLTNLRPSLKDKKQKAVTRLGVALARSKIIAKAESVHVGEMVRDVSTSLDMTICRATASVAVMRPASGALALQLGAMPGE
jgi:hypothetical protein